VVVTADLATHLEAVKDAVWRAEIQRRAPCHTLRHPLGEPLLKGGRTRRCGKLVARRAAADIHGLTNAAEPEAT
jgi:hypothetical protein